MIKFTRSKAETKLILKIIDRAARLAEKDVNKFKLEMDLTACHSNGCPLDFQALHDFKDSDFLHDIHGISNYIDRSTGKLTQCFLPRCARRATA